MEDKDKTKEINIEVVSVDDLVQDDHNFNRGTEEGARLIERSFREHGAGRSVLIDKDNRLVGGNKAQLGFKAAGKKRVVIVDSDADTLVAVRRKDVSLDSAEGRQMAYLDNLTTQVNLSWDKAEIESVEADTEGFEIDAFGFDIDSLPEVTLGAGGQQGERQGTGGEQKEAKANLEAEKLNAQAEIERAKGAAEAIRIENGSITPAYIQYLWVRQQNANTNNKIIYIPTEAGLPVLEAGRVASQNKE